MSMRRAWTWFLAGFFLLFVGVLPAAAAQQPNSRDVIRQLLQTSGIPQMLAEFPKQFKEEIAQVQLKADNEAIAHHFTPLMQAIDRAYDPDRLYDEVIEYFALRFSQDYVTEIHAWFGSPLGEKIVRLENQANTPEGQYAMQLFATRMASDPPDEKRIKLIRDLDKAVGGSRMALELALTTFRSVMTGLAAVQLGEDDGAQDDKDPELLAERLKAQMQPVMQQQIELIFLYTYRSLSDQELADYVDFYKSGAGRWFSTNTREGVVAALDGAGALFARHLGSVVPQAETAARFPWAR